MVSRLGPQVLRHCNSASVSIQTSQSYPPAAQEHLKERYNNLPEAPFTRTNCGTAGEFLGQNTNSPEQ